MKSRIVFTLGVLMVLWVLVALRGIYLQIIPNQKLESQRGRQFSKTVTLDARRGDVFDRLGKELAISMPTYSLYADPAIIEKPRLTAKKVSAILHLSQSALYQRLKNKNSRFFWIKRRLSEQDYEKIKDLKIRGLAFKSESKRVYPNGSLLGQTLGFVGKEGQGLEGIELKMNRHLRGNQKKVSIQRDARGRPLLENGWLFMQNPEGNDAYLTIDRDVQFFLEQELKATVDEQKADQAFGVVLDAETSAVIALASLPNFDPNRPQEFPIFSQRNRSLSDAFEPGSTMKAFLVAGAIEDHLVQPNSKIDTGQGQLKIGKRVISEAEQKHKFGVLTVSEVLALSSNVGTSKLAMKYGAIPYRKTLEKFGFGSLTGIEKDLPGEAKGILPYLPWSVHTLTSASFGHGLTATPLQIANAYAAIANGGILNRPFIVKTLRDNETGLMTETEPTKIRRVISKDTAAKLTMMLTMATGDSGTGKNARIAGFTVAGKTGTAQKVNPFNRGYLPGAYISSFAGFFPANQPKYVIYIAVDNPKKTYYGSAVAAPIFSKLAQFIVRKEGISPVLIGERTLTPLRHNPGKVVVEAQALRTPKTLVMGPEGKTQMPELKGLSLREVVRTFKGQDLELDINGDGNVYKTTPEAGTTLNSGQTVKVWLKDLAEVPSSLQ